MPCSSTKNPGPNARNHAGALKGLKENVLAEPPPLLSSSSPAPCSLPSQHHPPSFTGKKNFFPPPPGHSPSHENLPVTLPTPFSSPLPLPTFCPVTGTRPRLPSFPPPSTPPLKLLSSLFTLGARTPAPAFLTSTFLPEVPSSHPLILVIPPSFSSTTPSPSPSLARSLTARRSTHQPRSPPPPPLSLCFPSLPFPHRFYTPAFTCSTPLSTSLPLFLAHPSLLTLSPPHRAPHTLLTPPLCLRGRPCDFFTGPPPRGGLPARAPPQSNPLPLPHPRHNTVGVRVKGRSRGRVRVRVGAGVRVRARAKGKVMVGERGRVRTRPRVKAKVWLGNRISKKGKARGRARAGVRVKSRVELPNSPPRTKMQGHLISPPPPQETTALGVPREKVKLGGSNHSSVPRFPPPQARPVTSRGLRSKLGYPTVRGAEKWPLLPPPPG